MQPIKHLAHTLHTLNLGIHAHKRIPQRYIRFKNNFGDRGMKLPILLAKFLTSTDTKDTGEVELIQTHTQT